MSKPSTASNSNDDKKKSEPESPALYLLGSIGDTTWRMFVPIIGLLLAGRWLDDIYKTAHLFMAIGTILGIVISGILIKKQLEK